ncbi:MAG: hypothetical protein JO147_14150 [Actinobacteria bacterium]|nr:hypothetical protein [Actinomycetota bacterium]
MADPPPVDFADAGIVSRIDLAHRGVDDALQHYVHRFRGLHLPRQLAQIARQTGLGRLSTTTSRQADRSVVGHIGDPFGARVGTHQVHRFGVERQLLLSPFRR